VVNKRKEQKILGNNPHLKLGKGGEKDKALVKLVNLSRQLLSINKMMKMIIQIPLKKMITMMKMKKKMTLMITNLMKIMDNNKTN
jgi:hypothetical protein